MRQRSVSAFPTSRDVEKLLARDDIDMVYIATPPFLHYSQALAALEAGKHVICEKPLAMTVEQADTMIAVGAEARPLAVANLMQRYNPIFDAVSRLIESHVLGDLLHGYFENYASDENLPREHWFWDRAKSGGIFIEHGVHFFDLFAGWLGPGAVVAAQRGIRPGSIAADRRTRPLHGSLRADHPGQFLSWLPPGRQDGPAGAAAAFRVGRRDAVRLGAHTWPHPRDRRRGADSRAVRAFRRCAAGCFGDLFAAKTATASAGASRSTCIR